MAIVATGIGVVSGKKPQVTEEKRGKEDRRGHAAQKTPLQLGGIVTIRMLALTSPPHPGR